MCRIGRLVFFVAIMSACASAPAPKPSREPLPLAPRRTSDKPEMDSKNNLLGNTMFESDVSSPWMPLVLGSAKAEAAVKAGAYCIEIEENGKNTWDIQLVHRGLRIENGHRYYLKARFWASATTQMEGKVGMSHEPYRAYWSKKVTVDAEPRWVLGEFTQYAKSDATAELTFMLGSGLTHFDRLPITVCMDDVTLMDPSFEKTGEAAEPTESSIRVNQVGYLPGVRKTAVLVSEEKEPKPWILKHEDKVVRQGMTAVFGRDKASNAHLHLIDFTDFNDKGKGYVLQVSQLKSHPFDISENIYAEMRYDALAYFYHNRSGVPIELPYALETRWTRPAGHLSDVSVPCLPGSGCDYSSDVSGGWYDAGDHGKYVVNAGYAVWSLLNLYERGLHLRKEVDPFGDGSMLIPEHANGVPDLLDEARFEIEFMMKMMVPKGETLHGMVHHKIHDEEWTPIPTAPHDDTKRRYLHPPSTAATLNLSAVAAQCARIWTDIDGAFSSRCLAVAEQTFDAATAHPDMYSENTHQGGGPYHDTYLADEFFWAASELFITTGRKKYLSSLKASPHFDALPLTQDMGGQGLSNTAMSWQNVGGLGMISLAVVPNTMPEKMRRSLFGVMVASADGLVEVSHREGYRIPLTSVPSPDYYWGSNFAVMNNLIVLALAHDLTGESRYRDAVVEGMNYLMGQNPMDQCYVTGYGSRPLMNPHHRFWANQADATYPPPPPGAVSGGPNQHLQDPRIVASVPGSCAPSACFVDHIDSYSTNEVAINWNGAFAWLVAYMDDIGRNAAGE